ncbi:MAG: NIPSNAP family protein [Proteobacteria bacterium]|nr:NIPSNAP family protein [Pseudomonadota bacterium]
MLVETTNYFARPGKEAEVLAQRRHASALRAHLGLHPGEIFTKVEGAGPDVRWQCAFETQEAYEADMAARARSPEFAEARQSMHQLVQRFERHLERLAP